MPQPALSSLTSASPAGACVRLSDLLRDGAAADHRAAESAPFLERLMTGRLAASDYLGYLHRLSSVYRTLEDLLTHHRGDPVLSRVHDVRLLRSPALSADLAHWQRLAGPPGRAPLRSAAVAAYRALLTDAAREPWLLVAHHYTRYLGDLSGGRILARRLAEEFGDAGLACYDFDGIPRAVEFKRGYRERLDALPLDGRQRTRLVAEVRAAFDVNRALLAELG